MTELTALLVAGFTIFIIAAMGRQGSRRQHRPATGNGGTLAWMSGECGSDGGGCDGGGGCE